MILFEMYFRVLKFVDKGRRMYMKYIQGNIMLEIIIYLGCVILLLIINHILIIKGKRFFPIIILVCSVVIILISIVQIVYKQNQDYAPEVETIEISTGNTDGFGENNPIVNTNSYIEIETKRSSHFINLLCDFFWMNVPTALCLLDIMLIKKEYQYLI